MARNLFLLTLCIIPAVSIWSCDGAPSGPPDNGQIQVGSRTLSVDFLLTNEDRMDGVVNRSFLGEGEGILFVYPEPVPNLYWANRTRLNQELSVAFVGSDGAIQRIARVNPNGKAPVDAGQSSQFLLIVPGGWFQKQQITESDRVRVPEHVIQAADAVFTQPDRRQVKVGDEEIHVEIARTSAERARGLMHRKALPENQGMLFVYRSTGTRNFHMKNTLIPLDIAFIDESGIIREIKQMKPLDTSTVSSTRPAMYALEMRKDWFQDHGITEGQKMDLDAIRMDAGSENRK